MSVKQPNSRRNLDLAIEREFGDREGALRARRTMANVIVGQMLPEGVVKGGSALKIRFGLRATRFSQDLDADQMLTRPAPTSRGIRQNSTPVGDAGCAAACARPTAAIFTR